ncbi:uncharacterized protein LOC126903298 [Daktulosphaira vitifoliae]|uniref:uncharacterized protein LOC126903298 n=1 Tax=Daktulosphaira vitifoliae TaxID=58002 RepID=UPI0021A9A461|nr:uncharacterized protein LOC126903298 [Daktulosphaira vitifoliae]
MRYSALLLFITFELALFLYEAEGRRKILRGRKTITRTYNKTLGIPAWFSVTLIAFGILAVSGLIFAALQKIIIINNQPPQSSSANVPLTS